jgi:hypothetical protein
MPLIWCSISGHGYGHAAQTVTVLNALARAVPGLTVILRSQVPREFFERRLAFPFELSRARQDIGCMQDGPLHIDASATWLEHLRFHSGWKERVLAEVCAMKRRAPDLVLSNISYLAIVAGHEGGFPTVALGSLTWDQVLGDLAGANRPKHRELIRRIRKSYRMANLMIRLHPAIPLKAFHQVRNVSAVVEKVVSRRSTLRAMIRAGRDEALVLVAFGGIRLAGLPFSEMQTMHGYRFIVDAPVPQDSTTIHAAASLPFSFSELFASVDIILTKPGYSTVVQAVASRKSVVYVRRYNFADEPVLVAYLHRYGRGLELSIEDFISGRWRAALDEVQSLPQPAALPRLSGANEAARVLATYL